MPAPSLAREKYFPAKDPALANLVIVVPWGATQADANPSADIEAVNPQLAACQSATALGHVHEHPLARQ